MDLNLHGKNESFERIKTQIESIPEPNGSILKKYLLWHEQQLQQGLLTKSSIVRSLGIALLVSDAVSNVSLLETAPIERFWISTTQRKAMNKSQGRIKELTKNLSSGSLDKIRSQTIKFYKFVSFLNKYPDKNISLFQNNMMPKPECCFFLVVKKSKQRKDFQIPSQEKVKQLIEELYKSKYYYANMAAVFVAISNDCGLRFGEIATLMKKDVELIENKFYTLYASESKTAKRTVISGLAKKFILKWDESSNRNRELFFEPIGSNKSSKAIYNSVRKYTILAAEKVGLKFMPGHKIHTFRHCASSRLREMPENEKRYFMGWKMKGMEATYTRVSWGDCKKYYFESLKGNPMLDFSLSEYDKDEKDFVKNLEEELFIKLKTRLDKTN
jgi:integrase